MPNETTAKCEVPPDAVDTQGPLRQWSEYQLHQQRLVDMQRERELGAQRRVEAQRRRELEVKRKAERKVRVAVTAKLQARPAILGSWDTFQVPSRLE